MSILIIDDEPPIRSVLMDILAEEGYQVAGASNGLEALTYLRQQKQKPKLILLDLGMPVMSGWEFRQEQQQDPVLAPIPVIVMSAITDLNRKIVSMNVADCLDKPIDIHTLLQTVARYYQ